ncbi:Zinc finger, RING/FYVE/PHD-type [Artemisia annua]|uniref:Zinc finger, RING/FYVE/PHD-type n=1 Tax=Artemisia annua TaxID=35608 RepID=A0A2U1PTW0_ARTAN|nr:Zinc finger, RING/FYVE/PHD-type [Artemisia annua]
MIFNSKDVNKKKQVNRSAKLKQSKLDVRREQWLSQVKNKGSKEENKGGVGAKVVVSDMHEGNKAGRGVEIAKLVINGVGEENESDWDSPSNSPTSNMSSSLASNRPVKEGVEDREKVNCRAWRPDDAYRPQGLPNLLKQNRFVMDSDRHYGGGIVWGFKNVGMSLAPLTCPICCEDLDLTDSSFLPCPCGYRLCLFCYKRILEDNGRYPGSRKQYEGAARPGKIEEDVTQFSCSKEYLSSSSFSTGMHQKN